MKNLVHRVIRGGWRRITKPFVAVYNYFFNRPIGYVYMFHMVRPKENLLPALDRIRVSPEYFEKFLIERMNQVDFISINEMHERMLSQKKDQKPFGIVTFDDGYDDNFIYAYPILKKLQIPFVVYVTVNLINDHSPIWNYPLIINNIVRKNDILKLGDGKKYLCRTESEKNRTWLQLLQTVYLQTPYEQLPNEFNKIFVGYLTDDLFPVNTLTQEQIEQLAKEPLCTIGAHTMSHIPLNTNCKESILYELEESKEKLSRCVGYPICHMTYPNGVATRTVRNYVKSLGYSTAFQKEGPIRQREKDMYSLPRINVHE